jgi:tyrosinase
VFDPITGFGGDGVPGTYSLPEDVNFTSNRIFPESFKGCVLDGPFKDYTLRFGPGQLVTDHCLTRDIKDESAQYLNSAAMARDTQLPTFELFRIELEGLPITPTHRMHTGGHWGVGGEMSNFFSGSGGKLRR